jgi:hypothetical protein
MSFHRSGLWLVRVSINDESVAYQIKETYVGKACGTHGIGDKSVQGLGGKAWREDTTQTGWGGGCLEWIQLAQYEDRWRAHVNTVMNLRVLAPWN